MTEHTTWRATLFGVGTTLLISTMLLGTGGAVSATMIGWSSYRNVSIVWLSLSMILAFVVGGWVAGRTDGGGHRRLAPGVYGDLRSLGIELALVEVPNIDRIDPPVFNAEGDPNITLSDQQYVALIETVLYLVGMTGLALSAAVLGSLVAHGQRFRRT